jgi:hypothetical protein
MWRPFHDPLLESWEGVNGEAAGFDLCWDVT